MKDYKVLRDVVDVVVKFSESMPRTIYPRESRVTRLTWLRLRKARLRSSEADTVKSSQPHPINESTLLNEFASTRHSVHATKS